MPITEDVRDKIKKLHAMAEAEGGSEHEKQVAVTMRDRLLEKHGVTLAEVLREPGPTNTDPWSFFRANAQRPQTKSYSDAATDDVMQKMREELEKRASDAFRKQQQMEEERHRRAMRTAQLRSKYEERLRDYNDVFDVRERLDALLETQKTIDGGLKRLEEALELELGPEAQQRILRAMVKTLKEQQRVNNELLHLTLHRLMQSWQK